MPGELGSTDLGGYNEATGVTRLMRPPRESWYALLELKRNWEDSWEYCPEAELVSGESHTGSLGGARVQFTIKYGPQVRLAGVDSDYVDVEPYDLRRWWVRVSLLVASDTPGEDPVPQTIFVGRVESEVRQIGGAEVENDDGAAKSSGRQTWVALGPLRILQKIDISTTHGIGDASTLVEIGWLMGFNRPGVLAETLRGNRSVIKYNGSFVFGDTEIWSHADMIEYLLRRKVQTEDGNGEPDGPIWTLGGDTQLVEELKMRVPLPRTVKAEQLLRRLIPTEFGLDFAIKPVEEESDGERQTLGFEVEVFAMIGGQVPIGYDQYSYRPNRNVVKLDVSSSPDLTCTVEETVGQLYDALRVEGDRIIVCLSSGDASGNTMDKIWSEALETAYRLGTGTPEDAPEAHDAARADDRFRNVYSAYAINRALWDCQGGQANPKIELDGTITISSATPWQTFERKTLKELPLLEGVRYHTDPPTHEYASESWPGWRPPLAVVYEADLGRYVPVDVLNMSDEKFPGISVEGLGNDWGVRLRCSPNHVLARNHFMVPGKPAAPSATDPATAGVDWHRVAATFAIRSDHRLALGVTLPSQLSSGSGLTKVISKPEATFAWLAANTIVGVNESDGTLLYSPNEGQIVRDDRELVARTLAGATARFFRERVRATITQRYLVGWQALLGAVLCSVEILESQGGQTVKRHAINAPITSVYWDFVKRTTRIGTGQAVR